MCTQWGKLISVTALPPVLKAHFAPRMRHSLVKAARPRWMAALHSISYNPMSHSFISVEFNTVFLNCPLFTRLTDASMASSNEIAHAVIRDVTGYAFHNSSLLEEALDTTEVCSVDANRRLATIGDARLRDVILNDWYQTGDPKGMWMRDLRLLAELSHFVITHRKKCLAYLDNR